jgi:hypothetical protein
MIKVNTRCVILNTRCVILNTRCVILITRCVLPKIRFSHLLFGFVYHRLVITNSVCQSLLSDFNYNLIQPDSQQNKKRRPDFSRRPTKTLYERATTPFGGKDT